MNSRDTWGRRVFWFLLVAGLLDRLFLLAGFSTRFIGTDDTVIWSAAVAYGHGEFHEPYFNGQDYGVMLEALLAAPFARAGATLRILLPTVTALLAMLPFWSFAFWNRRHGRFTAACVFLAMPVLLPNEYGLMTSVTRGWVTGTGLLALLPWITDVRRPLPRSLLMGFSASLACMVNPNALPFAAAFLAWHIFQQPAFPRHALLVIVGTVPCCAAHMLAQAWCAEHPHRMVNTLSGYPLTFYPEGVADGMTRLDAHFEWLTPVAWPYGQLIGEALVIITVIAVWKRRTALAIALATGIAIIVLALGFGKTHDGIGNVFMPLSRMFLAVPLVFCWGLSMLLDTTRIRPWPARITLAAALCALMIKTCLLPSTMNEQLAEQGPWSSERPLADFNDDLAWLRAVCARHQVGLIVPLYADTRIEVHYRALLYTALDRSLPPTYLTWKENRYWVREAYADSVVENVLLVAGRATGWDRNARALTTAIDVSGDRQDRFLLLSGNTLPTDSLVSYVLDRK